MGRPSHSPIWPFLLVVAFLFLLSVLAPREWRTFGEKRRRPQATVATAPTLAPPRSAPVERSTAADWSPDRQASRPTMYDNIRTVAPRVPSNAPAVVADRLIDSPSALAEIESAASPEAYPTPDAPLNTEAADEIPRAEIDADYYRPPLDTFAGDRQEEARAPAAAEDRTATSDPVDRETADRDTSEHEEPDSPQSASEQSSGDVVEAENEADERFHPPADDPDAIASGPRWALPNELIRRLERLNCDCECATWVQHTTELLNELCSEQAPDDQRASEIISQLRAATENVDALVPQIAERSIAIELLRVRHALVRRVDVWELVSPLLARQTSLPGLPAVGQLSSALDVLDTITRQAGAEGAQWRHYLALDALRYLTERDAHLTAEDAQRLAREITARLNRSNFSPGQRQFIASQPVVNLTNALRPWTYDPLDSARLLVDLERFESSHQPSDARRLAGDYRQATLLVSNDGVLAERLETNYRNANLRLALSEKFLKRLLPDTSTSTDPVRDRVLGVPTRGMSTTSTTVNVKLVPDEHKLRMALEATGQVQATTRSTSGPATLHSRSDSIYYARKVVDLDLRGIRTWPAESECIDAQTRLRGVDTDFDGVPFVGALVENVARTRHADQQNEVRSVLRHKVEAQARQKMDSIAEERLEKVNRLLHDRVMVPLERMHLDPQVISASTSEQRLTMRVRLAGEEQLAGHTPRPRAPGDSLLSFQLHQSLFNNVCEQLELNGRTFGLPALRQHLIDTLNLQDSKFMDDTDRGVSITFADTDAIRVQCEDGRIELCLAVARLTHEQKVWKNFLVRVYYQPQVEGLQARLVRDGTVQLLGPRLSSRSQIALRGIFSKAFAKDRDLILVDPKWTTDERTRDLAFSQFVIQDGWIAVAVSEPPQNIARQPKAPAPR